MKNKQQVEPDWWPKDQPSSNSNSVLVGGTVGAGSIHIQSLIPKASYMNPIKRKADGGQML